MGNFLEKEGVSFFEFFSGQKFSGANPENLIEKILLLFQFERSEFSCGKIDETQAKDRSDLGDRGEKIIFFIVE